MAILVDEKTRVVVQGITGSQGSFHTKQMVAAGTKIVAGVTPGKGGQRVHGVPVYDLIDEAMSEHPEANASIIFVPTPFVKDAAFEAIENGLSPIVITTERVPVHDAMEIVNYAERKRVNIVGPDTPGIYSPGKSKLGFHPDSFFREGTVGLIARGGGISYEVSGQLCARRLGISTCVNVGGGRITGMTLSQLLKMFVDDDETEAIGLIGEIGGTMEEDAASIMKAEAEKPVVAMVVGRKSPPGKRMGHGGAIIEMGMGGYESKVKALSGAGAQIARNAAEMAELIRNVLERA